MRVQSSRGAWTLEKIDNVWHVMGKPNVKVKTDSVTDTLDALARLRVERFVEDKDATEQQRQITEVNMSTYVFAGPELLHALGQLKNDNRQREYYLTDCPGILKAEGKLVEALPVLQPSEALSINTVDELSQVEAEMRKLGYSQ
jgi:bifunctional N-acetylglucosamine-1-phosphate-uridyltransferase/glucosamine-1-phosphate-acetyltransferase GlmU-like protein